MEINDAQSTGTTLSLCRTDVEVRYLRKSSKNELLLIDLGEFEYLVAVLTMQSLVDDLRPKDCVIIIFVHRHLIRHSTVDPWQLADIEKGYGLYLPFWVYSFDSERDAPLERCLVIKSLDEVDQEPGVVFLIDDGFPGEGVAIMSRVERVYILVWLSKLIDMPHDEAVCAPIFDDPSQPKYIWGS